MMENRNSKFWKYKGWRSKGAERVEKSPAYVGHTLGEKFAPMRKSRFEKKNFESLCKKAL